MKNFSSKKTFGAMLFCCSAMMASADASACFIHCFHLPSLHSIWNDVDKGVKFVSSAARQAASVTNDEWKVISSGVADATNTAVSGATRDVMYAYNASIQAVAYLLEDALLALLKQAGREAVAAQTPAISGLRAAVKNMSQPGREALKRVVALLPSQVKTANYAAMAADLQLIAKELNIVNFLKNGSWGISVNADAGDGFSGVSQSLAVALNIYPTNNAFRGAIINSTGQSIGVSVGVTASVSLFWQPGPVNTSTGASIGFGMSMASLETGGLGVGISWGVPTSPSISALYGVITQVPSLSITLDIPGSVITEVEYSTDINMGQSNVITYFDIPLSVNM